MAVTAWALGIVRVDLAGAQAHGYVAEVRRWALEHDFMLRDIEQVWSEASFPLLIATLSCSDIGAVVVPELAHLTGWADAVRCEAELWALHPLHRWPRLPIQPRAPRTPSCTKAKG